MIKYAGQSYENYMTAKRQKSLSYKQIKYILQKQRKEREIQEKKEAEQ